MEKKKGIKQWAKADRPREKLLTRGRRSLTDAELLAILIRSGSKKETALDLGRRILGECGHDLNRLARLSARDLAKFCGVGEVKALSLVAAMELGRRRKYPCADLLTHIQSASEVDQLMKAQLSDLMHEEFWVLLLNRANKLLFRQCISAGGQSATVVDPKLIFKLALEQSAAGLILVHNHPSGNLQPSEADRQLTVRLQEAGKFLEIQVLDHVIVTNQRYISFAENGWM